MSRPALRALAGFAFLHSLSCFAQFDPYEPTFIAVEGIIVETDGHERVPVEGGDYIQRFKDGPKETVNAETRVPAGTQIYLNGRRVKVPAYTPPLQIGISQAAFGISGVIPQPNGSLLGGTTQVLGELTTMSFGVALNSDADDYREKGPASLSFGGWLFAPYGSGSKIFQIQSRIMPNRDYGFQLAYLNAFTGEAPTFTYHLFWQLNERNYNPNSRYPWLFEVGGGLYNDVGKVRNVTTGAYTNSRASLDPSAYFSFRLQFVNHVAAIGSGWFFTDRNVTVDRLAAGLEFSF